MNNALRAACRSRIFSSVTNSLNSFGSVDHSNSTSQQGTVVKISVLKLTIATLVASSGILSALTVRADVLYSATLVKVYTQSTTDSDAHLIMVDVALPSACDLNRMYIAAEDKQLYAAALANYLSGRKVDLVWFPNSAPKTATGHLAGLTCRVVSIF